jgi:asparagine synthase (glutamine-hydrolysing)
LRTQRGLDDFPQYRLVGHRTVCRSADLARLFRAVWHGEDLISVGPMLGLLIVAEQASAELKVLLTGEGSDELLGGYSWYPTQRALAPLFALPRALRAWPARIPAIRRRWPGGAALLACRATMDFDRYSRSITHLPGEAGPARLLSQAVLDALARDGDVDDAPPVPAEFAHWHPFAQLQYFDLKHRMVDAVVQGLDRATMAYSVEARVPFLDHHVVEYCARIPPRVKMRWLTEKHVLRRAMAGTLPPEIAWRRKYAMNVPVARWLARELPPELEVLLSDAALVEAGYFCPDKVRALRERHRRGDERVGQLVVTVLGMQAWHRLFRAPAATGSAAPCAFA